MKKLALLFLCLLIATAFCFTACCCEDESCDECDNDDDFADDDQADDDIATDDDTADDDTADEALPSLTDPITVVPSAGLPPQVEPQNANNNLDVTEHDGQIFLAFRTAPTHFASGRARLYVVSSADQQNWSFEAMFARNTDLREPRLLSWDSRLFLYFAVLGTHPLNFEPQGMMVSEYLGPGEWTEPEFFYGEGFIPWRAKVIDGVPYLLTYVGGESIYSLEPEPMEVHWLTTTDGYEWVPVVPGQPVVIEGGCSETDFVFLDDGTLIAVSRNEMGDGGVWGSKICRAEADSPGDWVCRDDPRKYDSPLVFRHGPDVYLIGRRNLNGTGNYDLGYDDLSDSIQHLLYELDYWIHPKRTSLWRIDPDTLEVSFVLDFPSQGDTCFPGLVPLDDDHYLVYNYTTPLDGPDTIWVLGQIGPTHIVRVTLDFTD